MNVNEIMSTPVRTCHANTSLDEVARQMWEGDCGAIPVVNDSNEPVGMVTDRDIAMAAMLNHSPLWEIHAARIIQGQRLSCCSQTETLENALSKMEHDGVRRIIVTDDDGKLNGILSMGDALAATQPHDKNKKLGRVSVDNVLGMLRKVSAHHKGVEHPIARIQ